MHHSLEPDSAQSMGRIAHAILAVYGQERRLVRKAAEREAWTFAVMSFMRRQNEEWRQARDSRHH